MDSNNSVYFPGVLSGKSCLFDSCFFYSKMVDMLNIELLFVL